jgi:prophage regulatory protein
MSTSTNHEESRETAGRLISANEVSKLLGVSQRTVWRLLSAGKLPEPVRFGGNVRWRKFDIMQWIDAGCPAIV